MGDTENSYDGFNKEELWAVTEALAAQRVDQESLDCVCPVLY